jgi:CHAT domain-containing protein/Tfp pilus assembly protein PilF
MPIDESWGSLMMLDARHSRPLFTPLASSLLLLCLLNGSVLAQSTGKPPPPIQASGQSNQQLSREESLAEAARLIKQADELYDQGRYDAAVPLLERTLAICEKALAADDPLVFKAVDRLGVTYLTMGDYTRAAPLLQRSLLMTEKAIGTEHPHVAVRLINLAQVYKAKADYARAEQLLQRSLAIREKALGADHPEVAEVLNYLAELYRVKGDYARAEPLSLRALAIREKALGPDHPDVATSLNNLALLDDAKGDYTHAEPLYLRALAINEKALGVDHPSVAVVLNNLAEVYKAKGEHARAEPLLQRSLAINEKAFGPNHPEVALVLNNLAGVYSDQGDYARAELLLQRSLMIREKAFGAEHPDVALALNSLADFYVEMSDFTHAEPLYLRALAILEKALGADHPNVAAVLKNLAALYGEKGDYVRAEPLLQRSLAIREKAFGADHPEVAVALNALAVLNLEKRNYAAAEPLLQRALAIYEKAFGPEHPDVAAMLSNLAGVYRAQGDYARAAPLIQRALLIREKAFGMENPRVAILLRGLAEVYHAKGDDAHAEPLYLRALAISEKAFGPQHLDVAAALNFLTGFYEAKGDMEQALRSLTRANEIIEHNLPLILDTGSERQKQLYVKSLANGTSMTISLHVQQAPNNPAALRLALTLILRMKGRALDAMTDHIRALRRRLDPQDRELLDQLSASRAQLSALVLKGAGRTDPAQHRAEVARLEAATEQLESRVSTRSAEFRSEVQPVTIERVQQVIPEDAALVELISYFPIYTKETKSLAPRYAAYVLRRHGAPSFVDLGEVAPINQGVGQLRVALSDPESTDAKEAGRVLDEMVMRPLRKFLGDARQLFISPDSALNLVPFNALVDEQDRYLVENHSITYLTSGRDLLHLKARTQPREGTVVIADPLFDLSGSQLENPTVASHNAADIIPSGKRNPDSARPRRSVDLTTGTFSPLSGTAKEAQAIAALFPGVKPLTQAAATEAKLKQVSAPRILHIATHGFFLPDQPEELKAGNGPGIETGTHDGLMAGPRAVGGENPLLRSGLVLAGANQLNGGEGEDGVLTALEAAGLDLWGTKLVVLSACQTGVGEVKNGDGVYGLRRALVLAGAESELMSLWRVDDAATSDMMVEYYKRLKNGEGRTEGLRQVQLKMLRSKDRSHPYYWASFIPVGDWRNLDGK